MKPQSAKAKGRRLQQQIVQDLLEVFPHLGEDDVRSTSMGAGGEDIQLSASARRSIPYSIEAKNQERVNVWSAMEQCRANAPKESEPIVVFKKNGEKPHVLVSWSHFKSMITGGGMGDKIDTRRDSLIAIADRIHQLAAEMED